MQNKYLKIAMNPMVNCAMGIVVYKLAHNYMECEE